MRSNRVCSSDTAAPLSPSRSTSACAWAEAETEGWAEAETVGRAVVPVPVLALLDAGTTIRAVSASASANPTPTLAATISGIRARRRPLGDAGTLAIT
jgi:hypothetical protein